MGCSDSKLKSKPGIPLSVIKAQLQPLDMIIFRGNGLISESILLGQTLGLGSAEWTHMGLVITTDILPIKNGVKGQLYIWESVISGPLGDGVNNIETDRARFGVQIRKLDDVIDKYDMSSESIIAWCQLLNNPLVKNPNDSDESYLQRRHSVINQLVEFQEERGQAVYEYNCFRCCLSVCDRSNKLIPSMIGRSDRLFCSALVVAIYQLLGLVNSEIDPTKIAPMELVDYTLPNTESLSHLFKLPPVTITREWSKSDSNQIYL